jgi:hypothetical protein
MYKSGTFTANLASLASLVSFSVLASFTSFVSLVGETNRYKMICIVLQIYLTKHIRHNNKLKCIILNIELKTGVPNLGYSSPMGELRGWQVGTNCSTVSLEMEFLNFFDPILKFNKCKTQIFKKKITLKFKFLTFPIIILILTSFLLGRNCFYF